MDRIDWKCGSSADGMGCHWRGSGGSGTCCWQSCASLEGPLSGEEAQVQMLILNFLKMELKGLLPVQWLNWGMFSAEGYNSFLTNLAPLIYEKSHMKQCSSYAILVRCELTDVPETYCSRIDCISEQTGNFFPLTLGLQVFMKLIAALVIKVHSLGVSGLRATNHF